MAPTGSAGGTVWEGHGNMVDLANLIKRRITWSQAAICDEFLDGVDRGDKEWCLILGLQF